MKKGLQCPENACIMNVAVTLIAMKREVAAPQSGRVFRGANVKRPKRPANLATSHCTNISEVSARARICCGQKECGTGKRRGC